MKVFTSKHAPSEVCLCPGNTFHPLHNSLHALASAAKLQICFFHRGRFWPQMTCLSTRIALSPWLLLWLPCYAASYIALAQMSCSSTTLAHQWREQFHGLLRIFVAVSLVLAVVAEACASIRSPLLDYLFVGVPFYLYFLAYFDLLETERCGRLSTSRQKRNIKRVKHTQRAR